MSNAEGDRRTDGRSTELARLAGGLAHEIRTPLSTLDINLKLLGEDIEGCEAPPRALARIETLRTEVQRLNEILSEFLRYARDQEMRPMRRDLTELAEEILDFVEPELQSQGITVRRACAVGLPAVMIDGDLIKQAVLNLVMNAQQAMPEGGELILRTGRSGDRVWMDIADTGRGIEPKDCERIFEAFFSTRRGGTGLGLATARRIVEDHGGSIAVEGSPGQGTNFRICIPVAEGENE